MKRPEILKTGEMVDGDSPIMLTITKSDVREGVARDPLNCAAAKACKRQLKAVDAVVMRSTIYVNMGTKKTPIWTRYQTPQSLTRELVVLDRANGYFEPGTFKLTPFPEKAHLGARAYKRRGTKNGNGKTPHFRHFTMNIR